MQIQAAQSNNVTGVAATGSIGTVIAVSQSRVNVTGVEATGEVNTIQVRQSAVFTLDSTESVIYVGTVQIQAVQFNYPAIANQYSRKRSVIIPPNENRSIRIPAYPVSQVRVQRRTTARDRTARVA